MRLKHILSSVFLILTTVVFVIMYQRSIREVGVPKLYVKFLVAIVFGHGIHILIYKFGHNSNFLKRANLIYF